MNPSDPRYRTEKPFHKPECLCCSCEEWREENPVLPVGEKTLDPYLVGQAYAELCLIRDTVNGGRSVMQQILEQRHCEEYDRIAAIADSLIGKLMTESEKLRQFADRASCES